LGHIGEYLLEFTHQNALIDIAVVAALHAHPHDAGVGYLLVIDGLRARRRGGGATGGGAVRAHDHRGVGEVGLGGAAGGVGGSG
jgi:hypothetical protein